MKTAWFRWLDRYQISDSAVLGAVALGLGLATGIGVWIFKEMILLGHEFLSGNPGWFPRKIWLVDNSPHPHPRRVDRWIHSGLFHRHRALSRRGGYHRIGGALRRTPALVAHPCQDRRLGGIHRRGRLGRAGRPVRADRLEPRFDVRDIAQDVGGTSPHPGRRGSRRGGCLRFQRAHRRGLLRGGDHPWGDRHERVGRGRAFLGHRFRVHAGGLRSAACLQRAILRLQLALGIDPVFCAGFDRRSCFRIVCEIPLLVPGFLSRLEDTPLGQTGHRRRAGRCGGHFSARDLRRRLSRHRRCAERAQRDHLAVVRS
jgi:hypothetical protein